MINKKDVKTPQEIELWIILPAIKKHIAQTLVNKYGMKQREVAKILNLTPAAISQYINKKRGTSIKFADKALKKIELSAEKIAKNKIEATMEIISLLKGKEIQTMVCEIHRDIDPIFKDCKICS